MKLRARVLQECQDVVVNSYGGSGSTTEEIHESLDYGVVKMNVGTDMQ
jgi:fructose-bisphosphate aldolase class II